MISRRLFIGMLAVLPAMTALAGSRLRIAEITTMQGDFDTANLRYKCTERFSAGFTDWRGVFGTDLSNRISTGADLSEKSLEDLCRQLQAIPNPVIRPTRRIVSPQEYQAIMRARDNERIRNWFERLWRRVMAA
jgi:hypothetical protein